MNLRDMETAEKIMWRTGQYRVPHSLSKEEAFDKLMERIASTELREETRVIRLRPRYSLIVAAAALLLLIGLWFIMSNKQMENIVAEKGHHTDYRLPDGSMVTLNADTKISFNKGNFNKKRSVIMDGEAFFNIEKGNTFTIKTNLADIEILGTSFNLYARGNTFHVSCFSGKILVKSGSQSVVISPREMAYIEDDQLIFKRNENIHALAGWRSGEFNYKNASLNLVFDEIERQYNVTFVLPELNERFFTGGFSNKNLVDALDIVCIPMGLTYEIGSNSKIFIKCKTDQ
jgi:transmembrane sensor